MAAPEAKRAKVAEPALPPLEWPTDPSGVEQRLADLTAEARASWDTVAGRLAGPAAGLSFETVVRPLMLAPHYKTNPKVAEAKFLQHVSTDAALREAAQKANTAMAALRVEGRMRQDVYDAVAAYAKTEDAKGLSSQQRHYLDAILLDFRRSGLALDAASQQRLKDLLDRDAGLCRRYASTCSDDKTEMLFSEAELEGMDDSFLKARRKPDGKIAVTLKYPDYIPVVSQCAVAATRKRVLQARDGEAYGGNLELMLEGVGLRQEIAAMLGYAHWADFACESRMTGSAKVAEDFLADLRDKLRPAGRRELAHLSELKQAHLKERGEEADATIHAWDFQFYNDLLMKREYGVDDEVVKKYFPMDHVVKVTMDIYQELLGLVFEEATGTFARWHEQTRLFSVRDTASGAPLGHFYLDLHPREGKYNHACIFHLLKPHLQGAGQLSAECMLCNLPEPEGGRPALLRHDDVVTFFHEFGHIMHAVCSEGEGNNTRLAKCPRDFVEAPSQMLENWCWEPKVLGRLSRHHETGAPMPVDLVEKLCKSRYVNVALSTLRQVYLATMDMRLHTQPPKTLAELQDIPDRLRPEISLILNPPGWSMLRNFGHLMKQYSAGYHGYLWAEVLSADMYHTRFGVEGCDNPKTGMDYRKMVLAPGGEGSLSEHLARFLGRAPSNEHFVRSRGLL